MQTKTLREKSVDELISLKEELQKRLYVVKLQTSLSQNEFTHKIIALKKDIARILTILKERNITLNEIYQITQKVRTTDLNKTIEAEKSMDAKRKDQKEKVVVKDAADNVSDSTKKDSKESKDKDQKEKAVAKSSSKSVKKASNSKPAKPKATKESGSAKKV